MANDRVKPSHRSFALTHQLNPTKLLSMDAARGARHAQKYNIFRLATYYSCTCTIQGVTVPPLFVPKIVVMQTTIRIVVCITIIAGATTGVKALYDIKVS